MIKLDKMDMDFTIAFLVAHTDQIYRAMTPGGKKTYGAQLRAYMTNMGISMTDRMERFFDNLVLKLKYIVPPQYREAMLFAVKREMVEMWLIERYTHEAYLELVEALEKKR